MHGLFRYVTCREWRDRTQRAFKSKPSLEIESRLQTPAGRVGFAGPFNSGLVASNVQTFRLRNARLEDLELVYEITRDAMRDYVEQTWGRWDEAEQRKKHRDNYIPDTHRLVEIGNAVAGVMATENLPDHVWLVKLYLLADFRGQGIGTAMLEQVVQEAEELRKPVRLRVLRINVRAQALYARHGFRVVEQTPERLFMERSSGA